ncbi:AP2 domain transcription factor AP2VIIa-9 [Toxoplasma gondii VEG]|uniref:AP2 domain transcription factor AP2VIIa-9 n=1 Tax=Toxoplasma gondii (strain ATCC 50861 / VEG) TaxID=432359 RepID=V4ZG38_TOXGV|nr:AP2 domain transcription factor AP2VIIa-9 [Toxoplasma gondii VEG]CEL74039.1 TPA: AP2 domain transcription factor AP2VIIa-9 [Toxoplasma gondii VEG]
MEAEVKQFSGCCGSSISAQSSTHGQYRRGSPRVAGINDDCGLPERLQSQCTEALVWALFEQPRRLAGLLLEAINKRPDGSDSHEAFVPSVGRPCHTSGFSDQDAKQPEPENARQTGTETSCCPSGSLSPEEMPSVWKSEANKCVPSGAPSAQPASGSLREETGRGSEVDSCNSACTCSSCAFSLERSVLQLRKAVEMRLLRVDQQADRLADNIVDTYNKLSELAADLDDLADAVKQDDAGSPIYNSTGEGFSTGIHCSGQALSINCVTRASSEYESVARNLDSCQLLPTNSGDQPTLKAAVSSRLSTGSESNGNLTESEAIPGGGRGTCPAGSNGVNPREGALGGSAAGSFCSEKHSRVECSHPEASSSPNAPFHAFLSAPIIPRAATRPRWWRGESQSDHRYELCLKWNQGDEVGPITCVDETACGGHKDAKTDDEGVRFSDGQESDPYHMQNQDFFSLTDVIAPFIRESVSPRRVHEHTGSFDTPSSSSVTMPRQTAGLPRPEGEEYEGAKRSIGTDEDSKGGCSKDDTQRLEVDEGEHLCSLLNGGGGITRWCSFASRRVGDFKSFTSRQEAPFPASIRACEALLSVPGSRHITDSRNPARGVPFCGVDATPWLAAVNTSYAAGIPALMLPQIVRGRSHPTRSRWGEMHDTGRVMGLASRRGAGSPDSQRDGAACAESNPQSGVHLEDGSECEPSVSLQSRDDCEQPWGPSCSEERVRQSLQSQGHSSPAGAQAAQLETKQSAVKGRGPPVGSTTMGATMAFPHVKGVTYNRMKKYWIAQWIENGQSKVKYFSTFKYGDQVAHDLAVEWRMKHSGRCTSRDGRVSQSSSEVGSAIGASGLAHDSSEEPRACDVREFRDPGDLGTAGQGQRPADEDYDHCSVRPPKCASGTTAVRRRGSGRGSWPTRAGHVGGTAPGDRSEEARSPSGAGVSRQLPPHRSNGIVGVSFSRTGNAWLAYIKNRLTKTQLNRYFKVNVYGFRLAKKKAIEARLELEERMRNSNQSGWDSFSDRKSLAVGVYYEDENDSWVACCRHPRTGEGIYKFFPVAECPGGDLEAREKAIDARMDMDDMLGADDQQALTQLTGEVPRRKRKRKMEDEGTEVVQEDEGDATVQIRKRNCQEAPEYVAEAGSDVGAKVMSQAERDQGATGSLGTTHVGGEQRLNGDEVNETSSVHLDPGATDGRDFLRIERDCAGENDSTGIIQPHESGTLEKNDPAEMAVDSSPRGPEDVVVNLKENCQGERERELVDEEEDDRDALTKIHAVEAPSSG